MIRGILPSFQGETIIRSGEAHDPAGGGLRVSPARDWHGAHSVHRRRWRLVDRSGARRSFPTLPGTKL